MTLHDLPMGGCSTSAAHFAHLDAGSPYCENTRRTLFSSDCGHSWVSDHWASYECPECGRYDGDHHLTVMEPIIVIPVTGGTA